MTSFQFITVSKRALPCIRISVNCHSFATVMRHKYLGYVCFIQIQLRSLSFTLSPGNIQGMALKLFRLSYRSGRSWWGGAGDVGDM